MKKQGKQEVKKEENKNKKDETVMYKPIKSYKEVKAKKTQKPKNPKEKKKHPKLKKALKIMVIIFVLLAVIGAGIIGAIFYRCIWGDWAIDTEKLQNITFENATMYDKDGKAVAVLTGMENREIISKDEMSPYFFEAFISIEDERFEEHHGVDWKRTLGAFVTFITHKGESSFGGSTLTQQVVKNLTKEDDNSSFEGALRKIKEIARAYDVENKLSKHQILELYLNLVSFGGGSNNIYGVQSASRYYFNKDAKDVSLVEAAYIAGITNAPNRYNPFSETGDKTEIINKRVKTVLNKMKELGRVSEEDYNNAIAEVDAGIKFTKGEVSQNNKLSYYLEAARDQVLEELMAKNNYSRKEAELELFGKGYQIYTNLDQNIQAEVDKEFVDNAKKWSITIKANRTNKETGEKYKEEVQRQGAMVVIDNQTGYVIAGSGGFGEKTVANGINRMILKGHSPGSCMKPIGIIGPSLEEGRITAATTVDDIPTSFGSYKPGNWYREGYKGYMNIRELLQTSANIPEIILLQKLTVPKSLSYLEKMGVDVSAEKDVGLSLALGGMTNGMTPLELATCYATVANGGVYRTPLFYTKVVDQNGKTVLEPKQESTRVFSEQNAWILQDLLKEPIYNGVTGGGNAKITGHEVRGKTGTTNNNSSASFAGFTKLYTASVCMFFDIEADGNNSTNANSTQCAILWGNVMRPVHKGLEAKTWNRPSGITTAVVCKTSGQLATEDCQHDPEGNKAYTEYFSQGNVPSGYCTVHKKVEVCSKTNKLASDKCKEKVTRVFITRENAETDTRWRSATDAKYMAPLETCTECAAQAPIDNVTDPEGNANNTVNNMSNTNSYYTNSSGNTSNTANTTNTVNNVTNTH